MIENTVSVFTHGKMEGNTKVTGTTGNSTVKEYTVNLTASSVVVNGMTVSASHGLMNFDFLLTQKY